MKITRVEPFLMSFVFPEPIRLPFWGGERTIVKRDAMLIRVTADNGLAGYAPGPADEKAAALIRRDVAQFFVGQDPLKWDRIQFSGEEEVLKPYHAVEIAVMDLAARYEGCPLYELLGGRVRDRIKLYGSAGMYMPPEGYAEEALAVAAMGFPAYKMRPALGPDRDLETVEKIRQAIGPEIGLMIDAHAWWRMGDRSYSFDMVAQLAERMAQFEPVWLEEPLLPDDHDAYRRLRAQGLVRLASGEHEQTEDGFLDLVQSGAVDVVQMDVCCQGGFSRGKRILAALEEHGLRFAFHSWGTALEVLAAAHLGVCFAEELVEWLEHPCYANGGRRGMYPFPLADEILKDPLPIEHGHLVVPDEDGVGIRINERVLDRYPYRPGPWSYFRIESPPETIAVTGDHSVRWVRSEEQTGTSA